jgi:hypothetical protein
MMQSLRSEPPERIGEFKVLEITDYLSRKFGQLCSETDRLSRNLLLFKVVGAQVVIRPSGTEPKVKIYSDIEGDKLISTRNRRAAEDMARNIADLVFDITLDRIGVRLSASAKRLPDHVDLDLRKEFDNIFSRDLINQAEFLSGQDDEEKLQWLKNRLSSYGAGADPIETAGRAVAHLCEALYSSASSPEAQRGLISLRSLLTAKEDSNN